MLLIHLSSLCIALTTVLLGVMHTTSWWPTAAAIWNMLQSTIQSTIEDNPDDSEFPEVLKASVISPSPPFQPLDDKTRYACTCRILETNGPRIWPTEQAARMEATDTAEQHDSAGYLVALATFLVFIMALCLIDRFHVNSKPKLDSHVTKISSASSTTPQRGTIPSKVAVDPLISHHEQERTSFAQTAEIKQWTVENDSIFAGEREDGDVIVNIPCKTTDSNSVRKGQDDDDQPLTRAVSLSESDGNAGSEDLENIQHAEASQSALLPELLDVMGTTDANHSETQRTFLSEQDEPAPDHDQNQLDELPDDLHFISFQSFKPASPASTDSAVDTEKSVVVIEEADTTHSRIAQLNSSEIEEQETSSPVVEGVVPMDATDSISTPSKNTGDIITFAVPRSDHSSSPKSDASTDSISHFELDQRHHSRSPSPLLPASVAESAESSPLSLAKSKTRPSSSSSSSSSAVASASASASASGSYFGGFQDESGRWNIDRAASLPFGVKQGKKRRNRRRPRKGRARRKQHEAEAVNIEAEEGGQAVTN